MHMSLKSATMAQCNPVKVVNRQRMLKVYQVIFRHLSSVRCGAGAYSEAQLPIA